MPCIGVSVGAIHFRWNLVMDGYLICSDVVYART